MAVRIIYMICFCFVIYMVISYLVDFIKSIINSSKKQISKIRKDNDK